MKPDMFSAFARMLVTRRTECSSVAGILAAVALLAAETWCNSVFLRY